MAPPTVTEAMIYTLALTIIIMNIIAVLILFRCKKMAFQIRIFTIHLAVADLLFGISLVLGSLIRRISLSSLMCRVNFHSTVVFYFTSLFIITCMSGDRCLALCMPYKYVEVVSAKRVKYLSLLLWFVAISLSLILLTFTKDVGSSKCAYMDICGKDGFRFVSTVYVGVILVNGVLVIAILWALFLRKNATGPLDNDGRENFIKEQKVIFTKLLGIFGLFLLTYVPGIVMVTILAFDFDRARYTTPYLTTRLITMCNSFLSPLVYVWRYPECRFMLRIFCNFWSEERQERLRGEMNRYMATFNMAAGETANAEIDFTSTEFNNVVPSTVCTTTRDETHEKNSEAQNIDSTDLNIP